MVIEIIDKMSESISSLFSSNKIVSLELRISKKPAEVFKIFYASEEVKNSVSAEVRFKYLPRLLKDHVFDSFTGTYTPGGLTVEGNNSIPIIFSLDQVVFTPLIKYLWVEALVEAVGAGEVVLVQE